MIARSRGERGMLHSQFMQPQSHSGDGLVFSITLTGVIVAIVSALCAVDVAVMRALFTLP